MVLKEVVKATDDIVSSLSSLISEKVHLPRQGLTIHPKHSALPWGEEVDWTRLEGVRRKVNLLGVVKRSNEP